MHCTALTQSVDRCPPFRSGAKQPAATCRYDRWSAGASTMMVPGWTPSIDARRAPRRAGACDRRVRCLTVWLCAGIAFVSNQSDTFGHDRSEYDSVAPEVRRWFKTLKVPGTMLSCCDESDCQPTEEAIEGQGYLARAPDGTWIEIPDATILNNTSNPVGSPVLCSTKITHRNVSHWHIYCFVPGAKM
jgi:hypothetical protein